MTAATGTRSYDRFDTEWQAQRADGMARLDDFVRRAASDYARRRNYDPGPGRRDNVSLLSPYLRHRLVLEEDVLRAVLDRHQLGSVDKFVQEVFWRAYFKGWLEHRPAVWHAYRRELRQRVAELDGDGPLRQRYDDACSGSTGIECFDAWAKELVSDNYLHNHTRMWFASIWIFTLQLPWQLGADFFLRHLLDGDAASNTLGWRWVGGLHTRGKTYLARPSNIRKFTDGRFDPKGQLATSAEALDEAEPPSPIPFPDTDAVPADERFGLLVTDEDCSPETLAIPQAPDAVLGLSAATARSPLEVSPAVRAFSAAAIDDALQRFQVSYGVIGQRRDESDWASLLVDWARANELEHIVVAAPPQGPVNDRLAAADAALDSAGIDLLRLRRPYDLRAWRHSTRGFFRLKEAIPSLLKALDLGGRW